MEKPDSLFSRTLADLRRRRVLRVAATYGVVAWLVIEVASVVFPALHVPDWALTVVVSLGLAGFPVVLLLAWVFDITPDGLVKTEPTGEGSAEVQQVARRGIDFVIIGVLVAIIGYLVVDQNLLQGSLADEQSIAVLPFVDLSQEGDNEYFSDGISEELLNSLVSVDGLRVAARTSSFAFKNRNEDVRSIGQQLNVNTVLEGSVRRAGDQVRITAQLINVDDGFHLWSSTYDRRLDDIFSIQAEIAQSIVDALKLELIGEHQRMGSLTTDVDIRAYDLYLLGRHHWHQRTEDSLNRALALFQQAVAIDESFALAYTGLADTYLLLDGYGNLSTEDALSRAELPVARALALDDQLAEAYASLGLLRLNQHDIVGAELALRKAIDLNPNYSMAHMWLGLALSWSQGPSAALAEYTRAMELDPLHPAIRQNMAKTLGATGRFEQAVAQTRVIIDSDPKHDAAYFGLAELYARYGKLDQAVEIANRGVLENDGQLSYLALVLSLIKLDDLAQAESYLQRAEQQLEDSHKLLGARLMVSFARNDMETLEPLLNSGETEPDFEDWSNVERLVWAAMTDLKTGQYQAAVNRLQALQAQALEQGLPPEDILFLASGLAFAQLEAGDLDGGSETIADGLRQADHAAEAGWEIPQIDAFAAVLLHLDGKEPEARARLSAAVAEGWRDYYLYTIYPQTAGWMAQPDMQSVLDPVRLDVAEMRKEVGALPMADSRLASSAFEQN